MDEGRIHTPLWTQAVEGLRKRFNMPIGPEHAIEVWLGENWPAFREAALKEYEELALAERLPLRYLNYFLSCVLSHHHGGTFPHSLPPERFRFNTSPPSMAAVQGSFYSADGYYRVEYIPRRGPAPEEFAWEPVAAPRGFGVAWPNTLYVEVDNTALDMASAEVEQRLGEKLTWRLRPGYAYRLHDQWWDAPLLYGPAVAGRTVREVLGLPPDVPVVEGVAPIPEVVLGDDISVLDIQGGAPMDQWRQPRVEKDPTIDKQDNELAERCEKVIRFLAGNPALSGFLVGGRPRSVLRPPGAAYEEYVRNEYRRELAKFRNQPPKDKLVKIRKRVLKRAERLFPPEDRTPLPTDWFKAVEDDKPWKGRSGGKKGGAG
ncbi:MAG: hypothetical protein QME70_09620 [Bacillota bacterium]|nr:hypothetical protein [Bacillota bacterium]